MSEKTISSEFIDNEDFIKNNLSYCNELINPKCKTMAELNKLNIIIDCPYILIVDDDSFNLASLEMLLKKLNCYCWKATNGLDAV